jgi:hypothetical protein
VVAWFRVAACAGALAMVGLVGSAAAATQTRHGSAHDRVAARSSHGVSARLLDLRPAALRALRHGFKTRRGGAPPAAPGTRAPARAPVAPPPASVPPAPPQPAGEQSIGAAGQPLVRLPAADWLARRR